ncbi:MAG TPA: type VI secretion system tip protein VgrG [Cytophagaceae bacterium]|jgi:Rhs element Vgr protein|nr:type VI secretion system tip protein VgrG [Cytophagaceae bacterium]
MIENIDKEVTNSICFTISINGESIPESYVVESIYILKEVNKISYAKFNVYEEGIIESNFEVSNAGNFKPGNDVEIKLGHDNRSTLVFKGIITSHGLRLNKNRSVISIECRDEAIKLTAGRKSAVFEKKKDSEIIAEVLKSYSLKKDIQATTVEHAEVVQHYCSDWDFIMMRAETCGLMVTTDNGKLVAKKPELSESAELEVTYGKNMISFSADIDSKNQYKSVTSLSWDIANQKLLKSSSKSSGEVEVGNQKTAMLSEIIGGSEYFLQSSINMPTDALEAWASAKQLKSNLSKVKGKVEFYGNAKVEPASLLKISGLSDYFNGTAFVGGVEHIVEAGDWRTTAYLGTNFEWYTEETYMIDPPSASGLVAPFKGLAIGIVKQIDQDKDGQYRIKVSFPTLQKDNLSVWARLANFYATKEAGVFFYPEINDEVVVGFLNEDPQHPVIMGMLYSSKNKTPFPPDKDNKIKAIVTKSKLIIQFDDKDKIIEIVTPGKNSIQIDDKNKQILITDENKNKFLLSKDGVSIETEKDFVVKAKGKITLESTQDLSLKASSGDLKGEGMNVALEGKTKFAAKGAMAEVNGSGQTTIKGGMVMIN